MPSSTIRRALLLTLALLGASSWAVQFTTTEINISPGTPFTLTWEGAGGPVEISLLSGESGNLETVEVIDSGSTGNSYIWTPPNDLPSGIYAFGISDGDDMNFSEQWTYKASDSVRACHIRRHELKFELTLNRGLRAHQLQPQPQPLRGRRHLQLKRRLPLRLTLSIPLIHQRVLQRRVPRRPRVLYLRLVHPPATH
ncbi:hypothetical protein HD806DRAFT_345220 [Xylariaceae sp. AK1471]|nr:hypothetical protein HD806DRAFT_345220 [Xylariaceae sp. AK1471]